MKIEPADLLACVARMTEVQKARFCELIDPAPPVAMTPGEQMVQRLHEVLQEFDKGRPPVPGIPSPEENKKPANPCTGMAGWVLGRWKEDHEAAIKATWESKFGRLADPKTQAKIHAATTRAEDAEAKDATTHWDRWAAEELTRCGFGVAARTETPMDDTVPDIEPTPEEDEKAAEVFSLERWDRVRDRWKQLFGEMTIPMVHKLGDNNAELETIEGMLYDKETKGRDPERCGCGCNFVIGCKGYQVLR